MTCRTCPALIILFHPVHGANAALAPRLNCEPQMERDRARASFRWPIDFKHNHSRRRRRILGKENGASHQYVNAGRRRVLAYPYIHEGRKIRNAESEMEITEGTGPILFDENDRAK